MRRLLSALAPCLFVVVSSASVGCSEPEVLPFRLEELAGTQVVFNPESELKQRSFYDLPFPMDARLREDGTPDLSGFMNLSSNETVEQLRAVAQTHRQTPVLPVAYFRFGAALAPRVATEVLPASPTSPLLLIDIDPDSPEQGRLFPVVAQTLAADDFLPPNVLAVAPRPGFVLQPRRTYAVVVLRSANDAEGKPLGRPAVLGELLVGGAPAGKRGEALLQSFSGLLEPLRTAGVDVRELAAATVFTTGDVVADLHELSNKLVERHDVVLTDLAIDADDGASHERFCELQGKVKYPQFQKGTPPFDTEGLFELGADGLPVVQREEEALFVVTLPKAPMPEAGYPLTVYWHGSGGLHDQVVDRGRWDPQTQLNEKGKGPSHVLAPFGIATAGSGLPVNPERLKGAGETAYLNLKNPPAFRDTFRQGAIEQRLFIEALLKLEIGPELLATCAGPTLPAGKTKFRFDGSKLLGQGQSMGGMYTNMIGAVEPKLRALVPTGAGGFWSYFILETTLVGDSNELLRLLLGTEQVLTFLHPAMSLLQITFEPAEPLVYMPRLARNPLPGHPSRPTYEAVGKDDSYFPMKVFDAVALAYGHQQAGEEIWPEMQKALADDGRSGILPYPVKNNLTSNGSPYTGVVIQYEGDGVYDPHAIYSQLDAVKHQYGCFFSTFVETGTAVVPAPAPLGTACPK